MRIIVSLLMMILAATAGAMDYTDPLGVQGALGLTPSTSISNPALAATRLAPAQTTPSPANYANLNSDVFGAQLFTGSFAQAGATQFNPDYLIATGDQIQVRFWGGFSFDSVLTVDPQGNLFLPQVGPVKVLGVRNQDQIGRAHV